MKTLKVSFVLLVLPAIAVAANTEDTLISDNGDWRVFQSHNLDRDDHACMLINFGTLVDAIPGALIGISGELGNFNFLVKTTNPNNTRSDLVLKFDGGATYPINQQLVGFAGYEDKSTFINLIIDEQSVAVYDPVTGIEIVRFSGEDALPAFMDWGECIKELPPRS